jgi:hypothetical protein
MSGFWKTWMHVWCWATLAFGAVLAAVAAPALQGPALAFYDLVLWPFDGAPAAFDPIARFTCAVLGAVMIGWALTIFALLPVADARAWRGFTGAMLAWYLIDSAASIGTGAPGNAVSNTLFLATFLIPVLGSGVLGLGGAKTPTA